MEDIASMNKKSLNDIIVQLLSQGNYDLVDSFSRKAVSSLKDDVCSLSHDEIWRVIDKVTGGLGYTLNDKDVSRLIIYGSYISWVEVVQQGYKILEIGTGLGRTCYTVLSTVTPSLYLTIDSSREILAIALYRNPYPPFQEALSNPCVKICLCDAVKAVSAIKDVFDHIIHDGGPNPNKNPELFSDSFLGKLVNLLKSNGTLSIFGSKNRLWQNRLYHKLRNLGFRVKTETLPYSPVVVFHCIKS